MTIWIIEANDYAPLHFMARGSWTKLKNQFTESINTIWKIDNDYYNGC